MSEEIILDRFEYKLPKDMYVVYKNSVGFKYRLKHSNMEFDSEDKCLEFIENTLKERKRKRYLQLIKTLSVSEKVNLNFANYYLDLFSTEEVIVQGY